jgi:hyperosmotically inducible periplasmic protein
MIKTMRIDKITLSGLIASLLASGIALTSTGCAGDRYQRSTGAYLDDKGISTRVKTALFRDPQVSGFDVHVNTFRGDVQLSGFVDTPEQKERASAVAREVPGVAMVTNNLEVKPSTTAVGTSGATVEGQSGTVTQSVPEQPAADNAASTSGPVIEKQVAPVRTPTPEITQPATPSTLPDTTTTAPNTSANLNTTVPDRTNPTAALNDATKQNLHIDASNGRATLRGTVTSESEKNDIERRVRDLPGVTSVDNELEVKNP